MYYVYHIHNKLSIYLILWVNINYKYYVYGLVIYYNAMFGF